MANNVMLVALKALNLCASTYIVIKLSTVLAIGIMFLIVSYAGVGDVGLSNLLAGALIILPLLVVVGGTLIVCAVAAYLNLKAPYRKKRCSLACCWAASLRLACCCPTRASSRYPRQPPAPWRWAARWGFLLCRRDGFKRCST